MFGQNTCSFKSVSRCVSVPSMDCVCSSCDWSERSSTSAASPSLTAKEVARNRGNHSRLLALNIMKFSIQKVLEINRNGRRI